MTKAGIGNDIRGSNRLNTFQKWVAIVESLVLINIRLLQLDCEYFVRLYNSQSSVR